MQAKPKNSFTLEYGSNPELAALVKNWEDGEEYTITIRFQQNRHDDQKSENTVKEISYDPDKSEADGQEEETEINPDGEEPVMLTLGAGKPPESPTEVNQPEEEDNGEILGNKSSGAFGPVAYMRP